MAYDRYTWQTGEVITQEKLNHMEDGIEDAYELPAVTETDNGKVLGVENGAWSAVNGGGKVYIIKCLENGSTYTLDKSYEEITDAIRQGYAVFILLDRTNGYDPSAYGLFLPLQTMNSGSYDFSCSRLSLGSSQNIMEVHTIAIRRSGGQTEVEHQQIDIDLSDQIND